ncbi:MAG: DNA repair protein RecO, partial [Calditrichaeota bacterium]
MSQLIKTEALVVHSLRWSESSKIVHLFTAEQGYLKVIAKGALRPKSPFRGVLEPLNHVEVIIAERSTRKLQILTGATLLNAFLHIREDLKKTAIGFAVLEALQQLFSVHEPVEPFFAYIIELLTALEGATEERVQPYLWHFLLHTSETLGFGWSLDTCLRCGKPPAQFPLQLDSRNGGVVCGSCAGAPLPNGGRISRSQWKALQQLLRLPPDRLPQG